MRPVFGEQRCHKWVCDCLQGSVRDREDERSPIEEVISRLGILSRRRGKSHKCGKCMESKGCENEFSIADLIHNHTANNDAKAETRKSGSVDGTKLSGIEAKFGSPVGQNTTTDTETYAGGENRHKSGP